ncbi:MAG: ribonuclease P protein component [Burkholderiales bacterium]
MLRSRSRASSAHFAVHHVPDRPGSPAKPLARAHPAELSTGETPMVSSPVDDFDASRVRATPDAVWLGAVVPKRHARRAVTRTLLKRQIRAAVTSTEASLAAGLWVIRLRAPFDRAQFVSAASDALKRAAQAELQHLLASASQRVAAR